MSLERWSYALKRNESQQKLDISTFVNEMETGVIEKLQGIELVKLVLV